jgi:hypothetical protein
MVALLTVPQVWADDGARAEDAARADDGAGVQGPVVRVVDEHVSITATETPVSDLLARIASEGDIEVRGHVADSRPVTVEFRDVPIRRAVRRLIGEHSFTMRYGADGSLRRITLRSVPVETAPAVRRPVNFQTALRRHPPIRVTGVLQRQFGKSEVAVTRLLRVVRAQPAGPLRTEAMTRFLGVVERDRELRSGLRAMTSAQLVQFLRQYGGRNARDLGTFLSAKARDASVRKRVAGAMRSLPKQRS